jgi:hypothetical protein
MAKTKQEGGPFPKDVLLGGKEGEEMIIPVPSEYVAAPTIIGEPLTFADVMRINRELREKGLVPADPVLPPKKRAKLKRF